MSIFALYRETVSYLTMIRPSYTVIPWTLSAFYRVPCSTCRVQYVCMLSQVWLFATQWIVACQAPLSMEFSGQEYWGGLPFPTPGDPPDLGIEPASLVSPALAGEFFTIVPPGKSTVSNRDLVNTPWVPVLAYEACYKNWTRRRMFRNTYTKRETSSVCFRVFVTHLI